MKLYCYVANDLIDNFKDDLEYYEDLFAKNSSHEELDVYDCEMYDNTKRILDFLQNINDTTYECTTLDDFGKLLHKIEDFGLTSTVKNEGSSLGLYIDYEY